MKIKELYINGFGHFHDYQVKDFSTGLTIINGPNEAGKSTLLAFIRRMLFGKPPGRSFNPYTPLNGGDGGRLIIESESGEIYNITRHGSYDKYEIFDNQGNPTTQPIDSILGSADQYLYDNIFAFGLEELNKFETLSDEAIQSHVTSAGIGIKTCSIPGLQSKIKADISDLYKNRGQKPLINKTLKDISEIKTALKKFPETQEQYDQYQSRKKDEEEELKSLKKTRRENQKNLDHWKTILGIWDEWSDFQENSGQLSELPAIDSFPEEGVHELDKLLEKIEERENTIKEKQLVQKESLEDLNGISLNNFIFECENEIRELERGLKKYLSEIDSKNSLTGEIEYSAKQFTKDLSAINPGWDDEKLLSFDLSAGAKSQVVRFRDSFAQIEEETRDLSKATRKLEEDKAKLIPELMTVEQNLEESKDLRSEEELTNVKEGIDELYMEVPELRQKKDELDKIKREEASEANIWNKEKTVLSGRMPVWPAGLILLAGILSLGLGIMNNSLFPGAGLLVVFGIVAAVYFLTAKRHNNQQDLAFDFGPSTTTDEKVLDLSALRRQKQNEISKFEVRLLRLAEKCGFDDIPGPAVLSVKRNEIEKELTAVGKRKELIKQKSRLEQQTGTISSEIEDKENEIQAFETEKSKLISDWSDWLRSASLDDNLVPDVVLNDLFPKIEKQSGVHSTLERNREKLQAFSDSVEEYENKTDRLLRQCDLESSGSAGSDVEKLAGCLKKNSDDRNRIDSINKSCAKLGEEIEQFKGEVESFENDIRKLFEAGSAVDEEEFRSNGRVWEKREELNKELAGNRKNLSRAAGKGVEFEIFTKQLESLDLSEIKNNVREQEEKLEDVDENIEKKNTCLGQISEVLKQLNTEDEFAVLESRRRLLLEDLYDKSREWTKITIAGYLLKKAVEKYEEERQPAVIQEAKSIFSDISGGRYPNIIKPLESDVEIEESSGKRKTLDQLSRGTAEQLYLAMRFGYINEYGKHSPKLPVVFDDILVNFDPNRKEKSCRAIAQLAECNQILYFTCHPGTVAMLKECSPDAVVVDLDY